MSVQLLDKTRKINKLLHNNNTQKVVFNDICNVLSDILDSNILVISKKGKILGVGKKAGVEELTELIHGDMGAMVDRMLNERLLSVLSTKENVNLSTLGFDKDSNRKFQAIIAPIDIAGERLGTLFIYKCDQQYEIDDIYPQVIVPMLCFHASALTFTSMQPMGQSFAHLPQPTQRSASTAA